MWPCTAFYMGAGDSHGYVASALADRDISTAPKLKESSLPLKCLSMLTLILKNLLRDLNDFLMQS